jgi:hypothetical protein
MNSSLRSVDVLYVCLLLSVNLVVRIVVKHSDFRVLGVPFLGI